MTKKYLLFILLFFSISSKGSNLDEYYRFIYKAEGLLINNRYYSACVEYKNAFTKGIIFLEDLRNAFKCSMLARNRRMMVWFWKKIKLYPELVDNIKSTSYIVNNSKNRIKKKILRYGEVYQQSVIGNQIDSMKKVDQKVRHECGYNDKLECMKRFKSVDSANIRFLKLLLEKYMGQYNLVGLSMNHYIFLITWHARRWGFTDADSILKKLILNGKMKPYVFAKLNSYRSNIDSVNRIYLGNQKNMGFGYLYWSINDTALFFKTIDTVAIKEMDAARAEYYLDKVEKDVLKIKFAIQNELFRNSRQDLGLESFIVEMSKGNY